MFKNMCWEFPAKWLPKWVKVERARNSKTIIFLDGENKRLRKELIRFQKTNKVMKCPKCGEVQVYVPNPYYTHICTKCNETYDGGDLEEYYCG